MNLSTNIEFIIKMYGIKNDRLCSVISLIYNNYVLYDYKWLILLRFGYSICLGFLHY